MGTNGWNQQTRETAIAIDIILTDLEAMNRESLIVRFCFVCSRDWIKMFYPAITGKARPGNISLLIESGLQIPLSRNFWHYILLVL